MDTHTSVHLQEKQVFLGFPSPHDSKLTLSLPTFYCHKTAMSSSPDPFLPRSSQTLSVACCLLSKGCLVSIESLAVCPLAPSEARTFPPWLQPQSRHKCSCLLWGAWTWLFPEHLNPCSFWIAGREEDMGRAGRDWNAMGSFFWAEF